MEKKESKDATDESQITTINSSKLTKNENENDSKIQILIPSIGTFKQCVSLIEKEDSIPNLINYTKIIDREFGVSRNCSTNELMRSAINFEEDRDLIILSGYAHLLLAEHMYKQDYDVDDINKEVDKAEALLDFAHLGGRHPLLPRTMKLKRRVNWKSYLGLGFSCIILSLLLLFIAFIYRFVNDHDIDLF